MAWTPTTIPCSAINGEGQRVDVYFRIPEECTLLSLTCGCRLICGVHCPDGIHVEMFTDDGRRFRNKIIDSFDLVGPWIEKPKPGQIWSRKKDGLTVAVLACWPGHLTTAWLSDLHQVWSWTTAVFCESFELDPSLTFDPATGELSDAGN